jgi:hypothetical protein
VTDLEIHCRIGWIVDVSRYAPKANVAICWLVEAPAAILTERLGVALAEALTTHAAHD